MASLTATILAPVFSPRDGEPSSPASSSPNDDPFRLQVPLTFTRMSIFADLSASAQGRRGISRLPSAVQAGNVGTSSSRPEFLCYGNYEQLAWLECCGILAARRTAPKKVAFIGSGSLRLTSLVSNSIRDFSPQAAIDVSKKLCDTLGDWAHGMKLTPPRDSSDCTEVAWITIFEFKFPRRDDACAKAGSPDLDLKDSANCTNIAPTTSSGKPGTGNDDLGTTQLRCEGQTCMFNTDLYAVGCGKSGTYRLITQTNRVTGALVPQL
ncbi:hypothetical protein B0H66DRAFT_634971 [Apodospora peruviana]|uniref:Uncharacterized protein n=1 Tax=Apodospora peruviana TaxID=516989 RepID=A0AAE0IR99_9PEZI|nr:hypothetical protein B0H66DRAFT_634971 [Apodospora peruviana]